MRVVKNMQRTHLISRGDDFMMFGEPDKIVHRAQCTPLGKPFCVARLDSEGWSMLDERIESYISSQLESSIKTANAYHTGTAVPGRHGKDWIPTQLYRISP